MKKIKFLVWAFAAVMTTMSFSACSDDDDNSGDIGGETIDKVHYDIWVSLGFQWYGIR